MGSKYARTKERKKERKERKKKRANEKRGKVQLAGARKHNLAKAEAVHGDETLD